MISIRQPETNLRGHEKFVLVAILVGLVAPLLASTWYSFSIQSEAREIAHQTRIEHMVELLASGMRDPVWNLTPQAGRALFESTLKNESVLAIRVTSIAQGEFLAEANGTGIEDKYVSSLSRDIIFESEKIGEVSAVFDNTAARHETEGIWLEILVTLAVQILISAILVYLLLRVFMNMEHNRVMLEVHDSLEQSERNYRLLFENAAVGIGRTDLQDGSVLLANKKLATIFGYDSPGEFISEFNFTDHYPDWDDREHRLELYDRNPGVTIEALFTRRDGSIVFTESEVKVDKEQGFIDFVMSDVSERHRAKSALKKVEHDYQALFDSANVGIGRTRITDAKLLMANQKLAEMFGYETSREFVSEYKFIENYTDLSFREKTIDKLSMQTSLVNEESFKNAMERLFQ